MPLMATAGASQAASSDSRQNKIPQKSPERPRAGKSKRTLIESACTACQKRKSRCDGLRPACTRCKTLHTDCEYNAEEGESRWSALRRKNHLLERERDEARDLVALLHSSPEPEAQELYWRIRADTHGDDAGALVHNVREAIESEPLSHYPRQHQQQQQQYRHQAGFPQAGYDPSNIPPPTQLPPLRSMVNMGPSAGGLAQQQPLPQPLPQSYPPTRPMYRQGSLASAVSNTSYSSKSSSDGQEHPSLSPREDPLPSNWGQRLS